MTATAPALLARRNGVAAVFVLNGLFFATLVSRYPDIRSELRLSNGGLGLLLMAVSLGSVSGLPLAGRIIERLGEALVVRVAAICCAVTMVIVALGATTIDSVPVAAVGLCGYGVGISLWDVAMNVEAAEVERHIGRTVMPRFHAGWSAGSIIGGGVGVLMTALGVPMLLHALIIIVPATVGAWLGADRFYPHVPAASTAEQGRPRSAWREPRVLVLGLMVLTFAVVEGSANDWLSLAVIDGYHTAYWVGVAGFWLFTLLMTTGRVAGTHALDRFGRTSVLRGCAVLAGIGILITVYGGSLAVAAIGIMVWGLGASLGFPVGMSAGADDPKRAAARVSVVSTIGYAAFLAAPPLLGWLGDQVGTLRSLLVVAALMVPAIVTAAAARPQQATAQAPQSTSPH